MSFASRMPALFLGHGNPMNALQDNTYTQAWAALGAELPRPRAVLSVSAHWHVPETAVTMSSRPRTIHDFGGFPKPLYEVQYPAPGAPELAEMVAELLAPTSVRRAEDWGLDHGTWSVLVHVYPSADVPVVQLSIDETKKAEWHFDLARRLNSLRNEGVMIVGSGNIVHNLHAYSWGQRTVEPYEWATRFENTVRRYLTDGDLTALVEYEAMQDATLAAPTPDHYLPLLYVLAQYHEEETISFPAEGFDGGSISMLSVRVG